MKTTVFRLIVLSAIILISSKSQSQENKFAIGITGAPTSELIHGNEFFEEIHDSKISYTTGITFEYYFPKKWSINSGLRFSRKGSKLTSNYTDVDGSSLGEGTIVFNFDYLIVPILCKYSMGGRVKFFVNAGFYTGILLEQGTKYDSPYISPEYPEKSKDVNTEFFKPFDFGFDFGFGTLIPISQRISTSIELRNSLGLTAIEDYEIDGSGGLKLNSTALLVGVNYSFGSRTED